MLSFIYKSRKKCSTISELKSLLKYFSIWYLFVTPSKNGEKFKPKKSDVKRFTITSNSISSMLLIHRNLRKSVLYNNSNVQKRRFDITRQHIFVRHKSNQNGKYVWEEVSNDSLREGPLLLALASYTTLIYRAMRDVMNCTWRPWVI